MGVIQFRNVLSSRVELVLQGRGLSSTTLSIRNVQLPSLEGSELVREILLLLLQTGFIYPQCRYVKLKLSFANTKISCGSNVSMKSTTALLRL